MYDCFVSYSRKDLASVERLQRQLTARGLSAFVDTASLLAGESWPAQIGADIKKSRLVVLCWSEHSAVAEWVKAEMNHGLLLKKTFIPWLLDDTPLPPLLQNVSGIRDPDPTRIADKISQNRRNRRIRAFVVLMVAAAAIVLAFWLAPRAMAPPQTTPLHGHIFDEFGRAVDHVVIEADGRQTTTGPSGQFDLVFPPGSRVLTLHISKPGYFSRSVRTNATAPDLGLLLEREK